MTAAAAVVRWTVVVLAVVSVVAAQDKGVVVDINRCKNGCSAVPEDLWPSCCEAHNTCCTEFAESCMHDCLPRVHTGDVSAVEERPGMCCALYNLCCFRETFRISSSRSQTQEPVSFPIVHRFHVPPPTLQEAINPAPRPAFQAPKQSIDIDFPSQPTTPSLNRPQLSKKPFRPQRPQGFKKPQSTDEERPASQDEEREKPKIRPKFGFLGSRKDPEERRKEAEERRKLEEQESPAVNLKVTRRPATADIRQEVSTPEVGEAQPMGPRRLDASINPVVTRKRMKAPSDARQPARGETRSPEPQTTGGVRVRKLEITPAREGRTLGAGRTAPRPSAQQTSSRAQPVTVTGIENPRPTTRRPPPPVTEDTPKVTVDEEPDALVAAATITEPKEESMSPMNEDKTSNPSEVTASVSEQAQEAEQAAEAGEGEAGEPSQQEAMEKKTEPSDGEEKTAQPDVVKEEDKAADTPVKAAFTPPEIKVNIPEEPPAATAPQEIADIAAEPARIRGGSSRGRGSAREQESATDAEQTQTRSRGRGNSRGRTSSRTASQPTEEEPVAAPATGRRVRTRG